MSQSQKWLPSHFEDSDEELNTPILLAVREQPVIVAWSTALYGGRRFRAVLNEYSLLVYSVLLTKECEEIGEAFRVLGFARVVSLTPLVSESSVWL